ncbi:proton-coupled folate transporter-like [Branchiostoma floridae x Branchiostoma belcheri]
MPRRRRQRLVRQVNTAADATINDDDVSDEEYSNEEDWYDEEDEDDEEEDFEYVRPYCLVTVEPMLFLYSAAIFMFSPISSLYLYNLVGNDTSPYWKQEYCNSSETTFNTSDPDYIDEQYWTDEVARWDTIINLTQAVPGLFTCVFFGTMSDQLGRRINVVLSCIAGMVTTGLYLLVVYLKLPVWALIPGSIIGGLTPGSAVFFAACYAYVVDISQSKREIAIRIAVLDAVIGLASVVATAVAGVVLTKFWYPNGILGPVVFLFTAHVVCILYTIFCLRETQPTDWKNVQLCARRHFTAAVQLLRKKNVSLYGKVTNGWNWRLILFLLAGGFYFSQAESVVSFPVILTSAPPFCWSPLRTGVLQSALSGCSLTSLLGILVLVRWLSYPTITQIGMASGVSALVLTALSTLCPDYNLALYITPVLGLFLTMPESMISTELSLMTRQSDQGSLFGLIGFIQGVMTIVTTPLLNYIWGVTAMGIIPGFVQLMSALLVGAASAMVGIIQYWDRRSPPEYPLDSDEEDSDTESDTGRINTDTDELVARRNPTII